MFCKVLRSFCKTLLMLLKLLKMLPVWQVKKFRRRFPPFYSVSLLKKISLCSHSRLHLTRKLQLTFRFSISQTILIGRLYADVTCPKTGLLYILDGSTNIEWPHFAKNKPTKIHTHQNVTFKCSYNCSWNLCHQIHSYSEATLGFFNTQSESRVAQQILRLI